MGGNLQALEDIIFNTDELGEELERINGLPFGIKQSEKYILSEEYIYNDKSDIVCFTPAIISKILESLDTGDIKAEIMFKKDNDWEKTVVKKSVIATTSNITSLSDFGMNINSINAKKMIDFFSYFEMNNKTRIEKMYCTSQLGWNKDREFLPYTSKTVFDADNETMKKFEAYHSKGNIEKWILTMKEYRKNEYFRFYINASFAAPLLEILRERGFFVHLWEDSGAGKTAALKAALSIWGDPDTLMTNFNSTKVAFEKMAALYNDLPMGIDERQQANDEILDSLVYMIANGKGKGRGNKSGGLQTQHVWKTIALTTGEEPLSKETSHTGVKNRLIEIQGKPFDNNELSRKMYDFLKDNYGTIGEAWIEKIRTNIDYIKKKHKEVTHSLESLKDKLHSHIQYMSIMLLTDELVSEYFFKEEKCNFEKVKSSLQTFDEADIISKAYEHMKSWVMSNYNKFKTDSIIRYGTITDGEAWIYPNIFEEELKKSGYPVLKVKKIFAQKANTGVNKSSLEKLVIVQIKATDTDIEAGLNRVGYADAYHWVLVSKDAGDIESASNYFLDKRKILHAQTSDADVLTDTAGNIAETLVDGGLTRTALYYHSIDTESLAGALASILCNANAGSTAGFYRKPAGITVDTLSDTQKGKLDGNYVNYYTPFIGQAGCYMTRNLTANGTMASGEKIQKIIQLDRIILSLQSACAVAYYFLEYNFLAYASFKHWRFASFHVVSARVYCFQPISICTSAYRNSI